jgi:hypothetical protein
VDSSELASTLLRVGGKRGVMPVLKQNRHTSRALCAMDDDAFDSPVPEGPALKTP